MYIVKCHFLGRLHNDTTLKYILGNGYTCSFSVMFSKGENLCDFSLCSCLPSIFENQQVKLANISIHHYHYFNFTEYGKRKIKMDHKFFLGYRKTAVKPEEVLISILLPFTSKVCLYILM